MKFVFFSTLCIAFRVKPRRLILGFYRKELLKPLKVPSVHQIDINIFKHKFRKYLLKQQEIGDETAWSNVNNQH